MQQELASDPHSIFANRFGVDVWGDVFACGFDSVSELENQVNRGQIDAIKEGAVNTGLYAHVVRPHPDDMIFWGHPGGPVIEPTDILVQYWMFLPFNDSQAPSDFVVHDFHFGDHEGDWLYLEVYVEPFAPFRIKYLVYHHHGDGNCEPTVLPEPGELIPENHIPLCYLEEASHEWWPFPGGGDCCIDYEVNLCGWIGLNCGFDVEVHCTEDHDGLGEAYDTDPGIPNLGEVGASLAGLAGDLVVGRWMKDSYGKDVLVYPTYWGWDAGTKSEPSTSPILKFFPQPGQFAERHQLTINVVGQGRVVQEYSSGDDSEFNERYPFGAVVSLRAIPEPGYETRSWIGAEFDGSVSADANLEPDLNTVRMYGDQEVTVEFREREEEFAPIDVVNPKGCVTAEVIGVGGTVEPESRCVGLGGFVQLTATPDPGFAVRQWSGTDDDTSTALTNTAQAIWGTKQVSVRFGPDDITTHEPDIRDSTDSGDVQACGMSWEELLALISALAFLRRLNG